MCAVDIFPEIVDIRSVQTNALCIQIDNRQNLMGK